MDIKNDIVGIVKSVCTSVRIGTDDYDKSLKDTGVDSLDMSGILLELEEKYRIKIPDEDIEQLKTVNIIVDYIKGRSK
jgi:acyl carrier protein